MSLRFHDFRDRELEHEDRIRWDATLPLRSVPQVSGDYDCSHSSDPHVDQALGEALNQSRDA